jgi:predicted O-methyltransferase YrrM
MSCAGQLFGTETFCHFLYSLVRMDRPTVFVELGCGGGATTLMVSKALRENGHGWLCTLEPEAHRETGNNNSAKRFARNKKSSGLRYIVDF